MSDSEKVLPLFLNFLNLKDTYSERDLESAILAELQHFISELGSTVLNCFGRCSLIRHPPCY